MTRGKVNLGQKVLADLDAAPEAQPQRGPSKLLVCRFGARPNVTGLCSIALS